MLGRRRRTRLPLHCAPFPQPSPRAGGEREQPMVAVSSYTRRCPRAGFAHLPKRVIMSRYNAFPITTSFSAGNAPTAVHQAIGSQSR
jgi:hypothetical protein